MYLTLYEKMTAVDQDFKKSPLYQLGTVPEDETLMKAYFHKAIIEGNAFLEKYSGFKGAPIYKYVEDLVNDWMATLERDAMKIREGWNK